MPCNNFQMGRLGILQVCSLFLLCSREKFVLIDRYPACTRGGEPDLRCRSVAACLCGGADWTDGRVGFLGRRALACDMRRVK